MSNEEENDNLENHYHHQSNNQNTNQHHENQSNQENESFYEIIRKNRRNFLLILIYSFFLWFLPSEPYLVSLLEDKGFTSTQIYQDIFPIWTYSYCIFVILLAILGEFFSYKLCIIIGSLGLLVAASILILPYDTNNTYYYYLILLDEFTEGIGSASSCIFSSFMFISFPVNFYATILGLHRSLTLTATVTSSILGGVIVTFTELPLVITFIISFFSILIVFVCSVLLKEDRKLQVMKKNEFKDLLSELKRTAKNWNVLKIGIWNAVCLATHQLSVTYIQSLFSSVSSNTDLNGFVYSFAYFLAAIVTLFPTFIPRFVFMRLSNLMMIVVPVICGVVLIILGTSSNSTIVYALFVVYHTLFEFIYTVATLLMALYMDNKRFASVFSTSLMFSLIYQSTLQFVVGKEVLDLTIGGEYVAFGVSYTLVGLIFGIIVLGEYLLLLWRSRDANSRIYAVN